jgi:mRNA interferase MazF
LVPFPFTDLTTTKQRPTLVVSPDTWNDGHADVVLVAITSQFPALQEPGEIVLTPEDMQAAGLPKPSRARPTKIFSMHRGLLRRTLGHLPEAATARVLAELRQFFS